MLEKQTANISTSTILRFVAVVLGLYFLYLIRDIMLMLFIAVIIAAAIDGPVDWLAKHKVRRVFGTAIMYLAIFSFLAMFFYLVLPPLAGQLKILANNLPEIADKLGAAFSSIEQKIGLTDIQGVLGKASEQLSGAATNILGTAIDIFGGIVNAVVVLVISIYLVVQDKGIKNFFAGITPEKHRIYVADLTERIQEKLGAWLRGQLMIMFIIGLLSYIGLMLLGVKFALTLALLTAVFEIIPFVGPILSGAVATIIALTQSPFLALFVLVLFVVIHQLEGHIIAPQIMKRVVGLNPLVVIISMLIGAKIAGLLGVVVAVPLAAAISVLLKDFWPTRT